MVLADFIGGLVGGAVGIFVTHPLDTLRVRAQAGALSGQGKVSYTQIMREVLRSKGFGGFYSGVTPPVLFRGFAFSINRATYSYISKFTNNPFVLGCSAGFACSFADTPTHLLKCRMQCAREKGSETVPAYARMFRNVWKAEGMRGVFGGFLPGTIFSTISFGMFYVSYDKLRDAGYNPAVCGVAACIFSWPVFYPLDVLRTRTQVTPKQTRWSQQFFTFRYFMKQMAGTPVNQWFPGLGMTLIRAVPRWATVMYVCEKTKEALSD